MKIIDYGSLSLRLSEKNLNELNLEISNVHIYCEGKSQNEALIYLLEGYISVINKAIDQLKNPTAVNKPFLIKEIFPPSSQEGAEVMTHDNDPIGAKDYHDRLFGQGSWSELEKRVRSNPRNRHIFEMLDDMEWDEIERKRLAMRPWWKKLLGMDK